MLKEFPAELGQREAARRALDQPDAEAPLQIGNPFAHRRFRNAEMPGRGGKTAAVDGLHEEMKIVEVEKRHDHLPSM
jgi:hypothetical protein